MCDNYGIELIVTSIKEITSKRRLININYEPAFALYSSEIRHFQIKENTLIDPAIYDEIVNKLLSKRATVRAMNLLKSKDYAEAELIRKLKANYYPDASIDQAIAYVKKFGYIDDQRYADNYIQFKSGSKSKQQIMQFLQTKGIKRNVIDQCFEEYEASHENSELDTILSLLRKKHIDYANISYEEKGKLLNSFYRKGFQIDLVKKALHIVVEEGYGD